MMREVSCQGLAQHSDAAHARVLVDSWALDCRMVTVARLPGSSTGIGGRNPEGVLP